VLRFESSSFLRGHNGRRTQAPLRDLKGDEAEPKALPPYLAVWQAKNRKLLLVLSLA
jgi:hypothetical protein